MADKKKKLDVASDDLMAQLSDSYAQESSGGRITLPRIEFTSQDKVKETGTGKSKKIEILEAAGTFSIARETDEKDTEGKTVWSREEVGEEIEIQVVLKRYQLKMFVKEEGWVSSPIYDSHDEVVPLFKGKQKIATGTPAELRAKYEFTGEDGKVRSKLEENRVLYVIHEGELFQMNLRGTSMYEFLRYERTTIAPTAITRVSSEPRENGSTKWNAQTFSKVRPVSTAEAELGVEKKNELLELIAASKQRFAKTDAALPAGDEEEEDVDEVVASLQKGKTKSGKSF